MFRITACLRKYGESGEDVEKLLRGQMAKDRGLSRDEAFDELVADACESMLLDSNAVEKVAELRSTDKELFGRIRQFIRRILNRLRAMYAGISSYSEEGKALREMTGTVEKLAKLFEDAALDAVSNRSGIAKTQSEAQLGHAGIEIDSSSDTAVLRSVKYAPKNAGEIMAAAQNLSKRLNVTVDRAKQWINSELSLASTILNPKFSEYLDYEADDSYDAIKKNLDYPQGTIDFSNICRKRREYTAMMDRIQRNFPDHVFTAEDMATIREIMTEKGIEAACGLCYVEDKRQNLGKIGAMYIDALKAYRSGNTSGLKQAQADVLSEVADGYTPNLYELTTTQGMFELKKEHPQIAESFIRFNNQRGMASGRLLEGEAEYKRQILDYTAERVKKRNDNGGLRIYSFSDFEEFHLIDILQAVQDCSAMGLRIQGYTKVPSFAKLLMNTGAKINRSLIAKGDLGYHIEGDRVVLDYDTVEGIDISDPAFFDSSDHPDIGNVLVGINDTHIRAAMLDDFVDYIIPFHTGQKKTVLRVKKIGAWKNYKKYQTDKDASTMKVQKNGNVSYRTSDRQINIYTDVLNAAEAEGKPITDKYAFVNKYLSVCKENGIVPRFWQFLDTDENGEFVYTEGYHKLLIDFKLFDRNGKILPQRAVSPEFDDEPSAQRLCEVGRVQKTKQSRCNERNLQRDCR